MTEPVTLTLVRYPPRNLAGRRGRRRVLVPLRGIGAAAASLLWLPAGFHLGLALAGGIGLAAHAEGWLRMAALAAGGVPLALACMLLWRQDRARAACAAFAVLGPGAVAGTLALEGFGAFAVATGGAGAGLGARGLLAGQPVAVAVMPSIRIPICGTSVSTSQGRRQAGDPGVPCQAQARFVGAAPVRGIELGRGHAPGDCGTDELHPLVIALRVVVHQGGGDVSPCVVSEDDVVRQHPVRAFQRFLRVFECSGEAIGLGLPDEGFRVPGHGFVNGDQELLVRRMVFGPLVNPDGVGQGFGHRSSLRKPREAWMGVWEGSPRLQEQSFFAASVM